MIDPISSCMQKDIVIVDINDTVEDVRQVLDSHQLNCVPVVDDESVCFGVISATDLVHFCNARKNPKTEYAWEICTHKIIAIEPNLTIRAACELMVENEIHHLIVVENHLIKGIVSSVDLIKECLKYQDQ